MENNPLSLSTIEAWLEQEKVFQPFVVQTFMHIIDDPRFDNEKPDTKRIVSILDNISKKIDRFETHEQEEILRKLIRKLNPWLNLEKQNWTWYALFKAVQLGHSDLVSDLLNDEKAPSLEKILSHYFLSLQQNNFCHLNIQKHTAINLPLWTLSVWTEDLRVGESGLRTLKKLIDNGLDCNQVFEKPISRSLLSYAQKAEAIGFLLDQGGRLDQIQGNGRLAGEEIFIDFSKKHHTETAKRLPEIIDLLHKRFKQGTLGVDQIEPYWHQVIECVASYVSKACDFLTAKKFVAWANDLHLPLNQTPENKASFWGLWAYEWVQRLPVNAELWENIPCLKGERKKWGGEIYPGIPDGVWAALADSKNPFYRDRNSKHLSKSHLEPFMAGDEDRFWKGFEPAFSKIGLTQSFFHMANLEKLAPEYIQHRWQDLVIENLIGSKENRLGKIYSDAFEEQKFFITPLLKRLDQYQNQTDIDPLWITRLLAASSLQMNWGGIFEKTLHIIEERKVLLDSDFYHGFDFQETFPDRLSQIQKLELQQNQKPALSQRSRIRL